MKMERREKTEVLFIKAHTLLQEESINTPNKQYT